MPPVSLLLPWTKAVGDVLDDDAFWDAMTKKISAGTAEIQRNLVIEGALAAQSVGVIFDFDAVHREALHITQTSEAIWMGKLTETTRQALRTALVAYQTEGLGTRGLPDLIAALKPAFGPERAERIAVTETTRLFAEGNILAAQMDEAIGGLQWHTAEDEKVCPICSPLHNHIFPKGGTPPCPAHVRCRCALIPVSWRNIRRSPGLWQGGVLPPEAQTDDLALTEQIVQGEEPQPPFKVSELQAQPTQLEGAHPKTIYTDKAGGRWLFKPEETAGLAEQAGYRVMHYAGLEAPETYIVEIAGKRGTIQRMWDDIQSPVRVNALAALSPQQLQEIQRHQVVDWLVSQHDTNDGALLIDRQGTVRAVDKGQAFKFLGKDKLSWTYAPNPNPVVYNQMFKDYIAGSIELDRAAIAETVRAAQAIDDDLMRAILRPYAERAVSTGLAKTEEQIVDAVLERKRTLDRDFDALYEAATKERLARLPKPAPVRRTFTVIDDAFAERVERTGWAGQSIMLQGTEIENGNLLAYEVKMDRGRTLILEGKLRPEAEAKLLARLNAPAVPASRAAVQAGDDYWNQLLPVIKHHNYHFKPGSPGLNNVGTPSYYKSLAEVAGSILNEPNKAMKAHYTKMIEDLTGHPLKDLELASPQFITNWVSTKWPEGTGTLAPFKPKAVRKPKVVTSDKLAAVVETPWSLQKRLEGGVLRSSGTVERLQGETAYTVELAPGIKAEYIAQGDANMYSKMGRLQIYRSGYTGTAAEIEETLGHLRDLGIEAGLATSQDLELLYLRKVAGAAGLESDASYQAMVTAIPTDASAATQVERHRKYWEARLGIKDITRRAGYQPEPQFERVWAPAAGARADIRGSWAYWERFDIAAADLEKQMANYGLTHALSARTTVEFFGDVLGRNAWMAPTEERIRIGVYTGQGWSPAQDQRTGGASYLFTRIMPRNQWHGYNLVFDKRLLLRTDNISYASDMYGRADPDSKRGALRDIRGWKRASTRSGNETCIKNGMGIIDNLVQITVKSAADRNSLIKLFEDHGITEINGRAVADVVVRE